MQKHGIVLGPDLSINGDVDVAEADESSSVDPASQPAQESQTTPAEGNSMLGKTHCGIKNFLLTAWLCVQLMQESHSKTVTMK